MFVDFLASSHLFFLLAREELRKERKLVWQEEAFF
jgi:hypothetical protein